MREASLSYDREPVRALLDPTEDERLGVKIEFESMNGCTKGAIGTCARRVSRLGGTKGANGTCCTPCSQRRASRRVCAYADRSFLHLVRVLYCTAGGCLEVCTGQMGFQFRR